MQNAAVWAPIVTAISAAAAVCFAVWQASADPASNEAKHRVTAKELLWIREQLLLFIASCRAATPPPDAQRQLDMHRRELTAVYKFAPDMSPEAYAAADKMLKSGHFTFSDDEIDGFLPVDLRKKSPDYPLLASARKSPTSCNEVRLIDNTGSPSSMRRIPLSIW